MPPIYLAAGSEHGDIIGDIFETGKKYVGSDTTGIVVAGQPFRYGFAVYKNNNFLTPANQVVLPFPPESISIDEPAATSIIHTQNSGKWIERRGQLTKTITISGTTGFNFEPRLFAAARRVLPQAVVVEQEGPTSGLAQFITLRNLFRWYWLTFSNEDFKDVRASTVFAFINEKDDEAWIVEPISFRMTRTAPRNKFTYNYDIVMQTVAPLEDAVLLPDNLSIVQTLRNAATVLFNTANEIRRLTESASTLLTSVTGVVAETVADLRNTALSIGEALERAADVQGAIKLGLKDVIQGHKDIEPAWMGKVERLDEVAEAVETETGVDPIPFEVRADVLELCRLISLLAGREELFAPDFKETWDAAVADMDLSYGLNNYDFLKNIFADAAGVRQVTILPEDTIYKIAVRELDSAERFHELVVLNNLKPPYLSPDPENRKPNTLSPGDSILVPATGVQNASSVLITTNVYEDPTFKGRIDLITSGLVLTLGLGPDDVWITNQWSGFTLEVADGSGLGQTSVIESNDDAGEITLTLALEVLPSAGDLVKLYLVRA